MGAEYRIMVVKEFIQLLVNSGHMFTYIKSVVLQGLTKYTYMVSRDQLPSSDKRYMPLHRLRTFKSDERKLSKYVNKAVWFTNIDVKDKYRNSWKGWIKRKKENKWRRDKQHNKGKKTNITTAIFIPKTGGGKLIEAIQKVEDDQLSNKIPWQVKLLEKPGTPLSILFTKRFEMLQGCYRGDACICEGKATVCMVKGVVYQATCCACGPKASYIGETARQLGVRAQEHNDKAMNFNMDSFMIDHWMNDHPLDTVAPKFKFKVISKHSDALGRQVNEAVVIRDKGVLNKKKEYALNEIITMEPKTYSWEEAQTNKKLLGVEAYREKCLRNFINVMSVVVNSDHENTRSITILDNGLTISRSKAEKRRRSNKVGCKQQAHSKRIKTMNSSTPSDFKSYRNVPELSPISPRQINIGGLRVEENASGLSSEGDMSGAMLEAKRTNLSNETSRIDLHEQKPAESLVEVLAQQAVTIDNHSEAEGSFIRRRLLSERSSSGVLIEDIDWGMEVKFNKCQGDSRSYETEDILEVDESFGLHWLFNSMIMDSDENGTEDLEEYYLGRLFEEDHFEEEPIDVHQVSRLVEFKKQNKLYSLFKEEHLYTETFSKRKRSPEQATPSKARRMTVTGDASPALRRDLHTRRARTASLSACGKGNARTGSGQKQVLLSQIWGKIKKNPIE